VNADLIDLPPELGAEFFSFLREANDQFEVADAQGLLCFIAAHAEQFPFLLDLFEINMDAVVERFELTGEVLPGIMLTRTTTSEASNEHEYLEQYRRMMRSYERFASIDRGRAYDPSSENYNDDVFAFFLNCYHLKDWIKNDEGAGVIAQTDVEGFISSSYPLKLCADICNSHKHLRLKSSRSHEYPRLAMTRYSVHGGTPPTITVKYEIETSSGPMDAFTLATQCLSEWQSFIHSKTEGFTG
jgi:hypothetical protein